jgi:hypothetical protein
MRIEILRSVMVSGEPAKAGSFIDIDPALASMLIGMNKAQPAPEPTPEPQPEPEPEAPKRTRKQPTPAPED